MNHAAEGTEVTNVLERSGWDAGVGKTLLKPLNVMILPHTLGKRVSILFTEDVNLFFQLVVLQYTMNKKRYGEIIVSSNDQDDRKFLSSSSFSDLTLVSYYSDITVEQRSLC